MNINDLLSIEKNDGIATIWLDAKHEKMNVVSPNFIDAFEAVIDELEADATVEAIIITSRKKDFIAGADIKSFKSGKIGDFHPVIRKGHAILDRIEQSKKPIVAAVHGTAFGLGTELSLACHARIASDDPSTKFALPEVKLGLLPGAGGTQRLPRQIGIQAALNGILTGKNFYARQAKKLGLVDELTDKHKLQHAAAITAKKLLKGPLKRKVRRPLMTRLLEGNPIGRSIIFSQVKKMAFKQSQGNYPAIPAIIDCIETGIKKGKKAGFEKEVELFDKLLLTPESKALISLFFAMGENKKHPYPKGEAPLETLGMIGAGFMGAGIAEVSVNKGIDVLLKDINPDVITEAKKGIWKGLSKKIRRKMITRPAAESTMGRIQGQLTYDHFEQVDIVIEAVLEKMDLKKIIIADIEANCREDVIIATNTSSLSVSEMAQHAQKPSQVIGMHYFSPVPKMPLLEIVKTDQTAESVIGACYDFGLRQGKTCIVVKDSPGFYVNRILAPYINECLVMIDEGIPLEVVDRALLKKGFPVGPITVLDEVGLDIAAHVTKSGEAVVKGRPGFEVNYSVVEMFEAGRLGRKNGKGFYHYDPKTTKRKGPDASVYQFFKGNGKASLPQTTIQDRAVMMMLNEAVMSLELGIIEKPLDGDLGAVFGIGFLPFTGGPFRYIDELGVENVIATMNELASQYGERFLPRPKLLEMAKTGKKFYR